MGRQVRQIGLVIIEIGNVFHVGESQLPRMVIPPHTVSILVADFPTFMDSTNGHFELSSEFQRLIDMTAHRVGHLDTLCFATGAKHDLHRSIEIIGSNLHAMHHSDFQIGVSGEDTSYDGCFVWEAKECWHERQDTSPK